MPILVDCGRCGQQFSAPDQLAGREERCANCGSAITIGSASPHNLPHEQWFVTLPDGRQVGPVSQAQLDAAVAQRQIPGAALLRRGDWPAAVTLDSLLARHQAAAHAAEQRAALPYGTYSQQFARNPLGTYFFGPKMPAYQPTTDSALRDHRHKVYYRWVYLLLAMIGCAFLLPLLAGLVRWRPQEGAMGAAVALFLSLVPALIFLIGMVAFGGVYLEWGWFMNARKARAMRAVAGENLAKAFYRWSGVFLMSGSAVASIAMTLFMTCALLMGNFERRDRAAGQNAAPAQVAAWRPGNEAGQPEANPVAAGGEPISDAASTGGAAADRVAELEQSVRNARGDFDRELGVLMHEQGVAARMENAANDRSSALKLHTALAARVKRLRNLRLNAATARAKYQDAVIKLETFCRQEVATSKLLDEISRQPLEEDPPLLAAEQSAVPLPFAEIRDLERILASREDELREFMRLGDDQDLHQTMTRAAGGRTRVAKLSEHLDDVAAECDELRDRLFALAAQHGYESPGLNERPAKVRVADLLAARKGRMDPTRFPVAVEQRLRAGRTVTAVEKSYRELLEQIRQHERTIRLSNSATERIRSAQGPNSEAAALFDTSNRLLGEKLTRLKEGLTQLQAELAEACLREGKSSELLAEPMPE